MNTSGEHTNDRKEQTKNNVTNPATNGTNTASAATGESTNNIQKLLRKQMITLQKL